MQNKLENILHLHIIIKKKRERKTCMCKNTVHFERKVDDGCVLENIHKFIHI